MSVSDAPTPFLQQLATKPRSGQQYNFTLGGQHSHFTAYRRQGVSRKHVLAMAPSAVTGGCGSLVQGPVGADAAALTADTAFSDEAAWLASGRSPIARWVRSG